MRVAKSIRGRLTVWYLLVLAAALLLFVGVTSGVLYWQLYRQLSRFAIQDVETVEGLLFFTPDGRLQLNEDYHNHAQSRKILERLLEVLSVDGKVLFRNWRLGQQDLDGAPIPDEGLNGYSPRTVKLSDGSAILVVSRRHSLQGTPLLIRVGYREDTITARIQEFLTAAATALPLLLAVAAVFGYQLAKRILAPLGEMAGLAEQITAENLERRLPVANPQDEIGHLGRVVNDLLDRLQRSFAQLKRFTADASHELRTPLAAIRSVGEVSLQSHSSPEAYRDTIGSMLEEVTRLTSLVESLLVISRADAGQIELNRSLFPLAELVGEVASLIEVLAEDKDQQIQVSPADPDFHVYADRLLLRQALLNILHNATKFSPSRSNIAVTAGRSRPGWLMIRVEDEGPGIPPEHRNKIFDRFYRIDEARTRAAGGTGLGLAIASWSVAAQGGVIRVEEGRIGAAFVLELPESNTTAKRS